MKKAFEVQQFLGESVQLSLLEEFLSRTKKFESKLNYIWINRTWSRWNGPPDNVYSQAIFENGLTCWNGPARSLKVSLHCGPEEKVLSVTEPSKCEYFMDMETSALCDESVLSKPVTKPSGEPIHEEL